MADDKAVRIVGWAPAPLPMTHAYTGNHPLRIAAGFGTAPLGVHVSADGGQPFALSLSMLLAAPGAIPMCLSLCESICATSDYTVGITIFNKPVVTIRLQGRTVFSLDK
jgi:hypothetical protein